MFYAYNLLGMNAYALALHCGCPLLLRDELTVHCICDRYRTFTFTLPL